jgi:hypothetical protein
MSGVFTSSSPTLIRPNKTTGHVVSALAHALGAPKGHLDQTTFLAFEDALARSERTFCPRIRWCPQCMSDWSTSGREAYFLLIWQLQVVTHCVHHNVALRDTCAACGSNQNGLGMRRDLSTCARCGASLGVLAKAAEPTREAGELLEVVGYFASRLGYRFPRDAVQRLLLHLLDSAWETHEEDFLYRKMGRDRLLHLLSSKQRITLKTALSISHSLDIPLLMLLLGDIRPLTARLPGIAAAPCAPTSTHVRQRIADPSATRRTIVTAIKNVSYSTPLRVLAERVGVSVGALRYRFPDLIEQWVTLFRASCRKRRSAILARCRKVVCRRIRDLQATSPATISGRSLYSQLREETALPEDVLKHEIRRQLSLMARKRSPSC